MGRGTGLRQRGTVEVGEREGKIRPGKGACDINSLTRRSGLDAL